MAGDRHASRTTGPDLFPVPPALAPRSWSVLGPAGAALVLAVALAGALSDSGVVLIAGLAGVLIGVGVLGRRGDAVVVGLLAVAGAALGGAATDWSSVDWVLGVAVIGAVATSSALAVL